MIGAGWCLRSGGTMGITTACARRPAGASICEPALMDHQTFPDGEH